MSEYGELVEDGTVRFERLLPGPIERVWRYLSESEKRAQWLCSGDVEDSIGGTIEMHFHNLSLSKEGDIPRPEKYAGRPEKVSFTGEVTLYEPPHKLHHTWIFDGEPSEVCYELVAKGDNVRLILTHRRIATSDSVQDVSGGWHTHLNVLEDVLSGGPMRPFYKMQLQYDAEYAERLRDS